MKGYKGRTTAASFCVCPGHPDFEGARIVLVREGLLVANMQDASVYVCVYVWVWVFVTPSMAGQMWHHHLSIKKALS
eukprot:scaffold67473_cov20-Tisochrysis_lutea.AAC.1